MTDSLARLGFQIDSRAATEAAAALDRLTRESASAAQAAGALAAADNGTVAAIDRMTAAITREVAALSQSSAALGTAVTASAAASAASAKLAADLGLQAAAWAKASVAANENAKAVRSAASGWQALSSIGSANYGDLLASQRITQMNSALAETSVVAAAAGHSLRQNQADAINLSRQFADIGVMTAMGMSPLMTVITQGPQISDAIGKRGLAGSLTLVKEGLTSLINPAFLALAALTALGYGAYAIFDAMTDDVRSVEDTIDDHTKLIQELQKEYGILGEEADKAAKKTRGMLEIGTRAAIDENRQQQLREGRNILQQLGSYSVGAGVPYDPLLPGQGMGVLDAELEFVTDPKFAAFDEPIRRFMQELEDGRPDVEALEKAITNIARADGSLGLAKLADEIDGIITTARTLAKQGGSLDLSALHMTPAQRERTARYEDLVERQRRERALIEHRAGMPRPKPSNVDFPDPAADLVREARRTVDEQMAALRLQATTFGKTAGEIARAEEMQRLLNQAQRQNIELTPELQASFSDIADAIGRVAQASEDLTLKQEQLVNALDTVRSTSNETLGGIVRDLAQGKDGAEALRNALGRIGERMITGGTEAITEGLFGQRGKPGGGMFGGQIGGWLGQMLGLPAAEAAAMDAQNALGAMSIGTATISAGSVTVIGYAQAGSGISFPPTGGPANSNIAGAAGALANVAGLNVGDKASSLDDTFESQLRQMIADGQAAGHSISVNSAYRSVERQKQLYDEAIAKYGPGQRMVAPPGRSNHNFGVAADLGYGSAEARQWAHQNASNYGLKFPMSWENWHIEPEGLRTGGYAKPTLSQAAINAQNGLAGVPMVDSSAIASAAASAQQATQSFEALGGVLGETTPQVGGLGNALSGLFGGQGSSGSGGGFNLSGFVPMIAGLFMSEGGKVRGPGSETSDSIPAMLSDGEFVVRAKSAKKHGPLLVAINEDRLPHYSEGGFVTRDFDSQMESIGGGGANGRSDGMTYVDRSINIAGDASEKTVELIRMEQRLSEERQRQSAKVGIGKMNETYAKLRG